MTPLLFSLATPFPLTGLPSARTLTSLPTCALRGPSAPKPDYRQTDASPLNRLLLGHFLSALRAELRRDGHGADDFLAADAAATFSAVVAAVRDLGGRRRGPGALRAASVRVLRAAIPAWLPGLFAALFAARAPRVAARLCAVVCVACTQWLMGASRVGADGVSVEIDRCRYLEETACAGLCLHSCKTATELYFARHMRLPLAIEPDLDTLQCTFRFGQPPPPPDEDPLLRHPCFPHCPVAQAAPGTERLCERGEEAGNAAHAEG